MALTLDPPALPPPFLVDQGAAGGAAWPVSIPGTVPTRAALRNTFIARVNDEVPAVNKHMLFVYNGSNANPVRIWRVFVYISSEAAVAGVLGKYRLIRWTSINPGPFTGVTGIPLDTGVALPGNFSIGKIPTGVITLGDELKRALLSTDEAVVSTLDADALSSEDFPRFAIWDVLPPELTPLSLNITGPPNGFSEGLSLQWLVGTAGNIGVEMWGTWE